MQFFVHSFEFPFLVRFGSKNGNNYRIAMSFILIFIVLVYCMFGDLSIFGTFDGFMKWFNDLLSGESFTDAALVTLAIAPFAVGVLYYFSYKISCKLYLKGAENYDK